MQVAPLAGWTRQLRTVDSMNSKQYCIQTMNHKILLVATAAAGIAAVAVVIVSKLFNLDSVSGGAVGGAVGAAVSVVLVGKKRIDKTN